MRAPDIGGQSVSRGYTCEIVEKEGTEITGGVEVVSLSAERITTRLNHILARIFI